MFDVAFRRPVWVSIDICNAYYSRTDSFGLKIITTACSCVQFWGTFFPQFTCCTKFVSIKREYSSTLHYTLQYSTYIIRSYIICNHIESATIYGLRAVEMVRDLLLTSHWTVRKSFAEIMYSNFSRARVFKTQKKT